jgi:hypothetical protein
VFAVTEEMVVEIAKRDKKIVIEVTAGWYLLLDENKVEDEMPRETFLFLRHRCVLTTAGLDIGVRAFCPDPGLGKTL